MDIGDISKIIRAFSIVSGWTAQAFEDNRITIVEAAQLAEQLGQAFGIPTSIEVPDK